MGQQPRKKRKKEKQILQQSAHHRTIYTIPLLSGN
jgi:hypothetical protein